MKQKKTEPAGADALPVQPSAPEVETLAGKDKLALTLYAFLAFVAITFSSGKGTMFLLLVSIVPLLLPFFWKRPFGYVSVHAALPVWALIVLSVSYCAASIYSPFGESAVAVLYKFMVALVMAVLALVWFDHRHVRGLLWGLSAVITAVAFISIDGASAALFFTPFSQFMNGLGVDTVSFSMGTVGTRINGLYNDANVTASLFSIAMLLEFHLARTANGWKSRLMACELLGICTMGFILSVSRGAMVCIFVAAIAYWALSPAGTRLRLLFQMAAAVVVSVLASWSIMSTPQDSLLPDLAALVCGVAIYVVDWLLGDRVTAIFTGRVKILWGTTAVLGVLAVVYMVAAFQLTEPYTFSNASVFGRVIEMDPGHYTLSVQYDGQAKVAVHVFDKSALMNENNVVEVYRGPFESASFDIPEGTEKVRFMFEGEHGTVLHSATLSDGTQIKLKYSLLPGSIADRMQGSIFKDSSFLLRLQYMKDALKIWGTSPIWGRGLGSTEGLYSAVQPFHYMSLYVHSHLLQYMADMGLVGLLAFLAYMGGTLWLLLRQWWNHREDMLPPALIACLVMINVHSLMEINMSLRSFLTVTLILCTVVTIAYGEEPLLLKGKGKQYEKTAKRLGLTCGALLCAFLLVFGGLLQVYRSVHRASSEYESENYDEFMDTLDKFILLDCFNDDYYRQIYVRNAYNEPARAAKVAKHVKYLYDSGTYDNCATLAAAYYLPYGSMEKMFECSRRAIAQSPSLPRAWNYQIEFYRDTVLPLIDTSLMNEYLDGVLATKDYLASYNQSRLEVVEVDKSNQDFLDAALKAWKDGMDAETAYDYLSTFVQEQ